MIVNGPQKYPPLAATKDTQMAELSVEIRVFI